MSISGQNVAYIGNGVIDFTDNSNGVFDLVLISGKFQRFGQTVEIESTVDLNPATFAFTQLSEAPPNFASTANADRITCCGSTYTLIVEGGKPRYSRSRAVCFSRLRLNAHTIAHNPGS